MRSFVLAVILGFLSVAAAAQTEDDLLRWVQATRPLVEAGQMSSLEFHREMHRRISSIPAESYPFKLTNLRWVGRKIDILEDLEAGKITRDQATRRLAEEDAAVESADQERLQTRRQAQAAREDALRQQQQQAAAADEAQRRAIAGQLLMQQMGRTPVIPSSPGVPLYQVPRQSRCSSQWVGNQWQTVCN